MSWIRNGPCSECGSSDGRAIYHDHEFCYVCNKPYDSGHIRRDKPLTEYNELTPRGISKATAQKYGVTYDGKTYSFPYFDKPGKVHIATKSRDANLKDKMWVDGPFKEAGLFGKQLFEAGSAKAITLVEGEFDALAAFEIQGSRYPVVSVKNGAAGAVRDCVGDFEYLNSFETIVIAFDKDEAKVHPTTGATTYPGQEAAIAVANLFPIGKVKILTFKLYKDSNDYLLHGKSKDFIQEWWAAPSYTPSGLKLGRDLWDEVSKPRKYETIPYPFGGLNDNTYGLRLSEFVVITADPKIGKTQICREIAFGIRKEAPDKGLGLICLEEPNYDTALGLMSIVANKPLHLPDVRETVTKEELRKYFDVIMDTEHIVVWDHFGSNSIHEVLAKIRHMAAMGCKYIILDHLSIIVSDQSGDERKQLDEISTKIKTLCMELNICVLAVIHQNRQGQIRGTAGVEQLANIVIKLERETEDPDPWRRNVTKVTIKYNRFCGRTGPACWLFYDPNTGRLIELNEDDVRRYETGVVQESWSFPTKS